MQRCLNCYNSVICYKFNKAKWDKHHEEDDCTCKNWEDDSVNWGSDEDYDDD